jgi:hypothetical protein
MNSLQASQGASDSNSGPYKAEMGLLQGFDSGGDPVEAYFECISQCSLDDGECVTVCTTMLREKS